MPLKESRGQVKARRQARWFPLSEHSGEEPEASRPLERFERPRLRGKLGGNAEFSVPDMVGRRAFFFLARK